MSLFNTQTGKGIPKHKRPRLSLLSSMQADWFMVLMLAFFGIVCAVYIAQVRFDDVSAAVISAQSRREGKATLVVPEATEMLRVFNERVSAAPTATSTSTSTPQAEAPAP